MKIEISLPHNAGNITVDFDTLPEVTKAWAIAYGVRQGVVDAAASAKAYAAETNVSLVDAVNALVEKRLIAMESGTVGMRAPANPLRVELIRVLSLASPTFKKLDKKVQNEKADAIIAGGGNEAAQGYLEEAKRRLEKAAPVAEVDLGL